MATDLKVMLNRLEDWLLAGMLSGVILLASGQILLRNLFEIPIIWIDPLLRVAVLWLALQGAMVATREKTHIAIDLLSRAMPLIWSYRISRLIDISTGLICLLLAWYSLQLVLLEFEDQLIAFAHVPVWLCQSIMPLAFVVMAVRFIRQGMFPGHHDRTANRGGHARGSVS